mgnify:CR=1 FL=1|tara:strand:+ start:44 stop:388 length:345 start_codon:yes stop_codon:yes gene_type:complete
MTFVTLQEFIALHPELYIPNWVGFKPRVQVHVDTDSSESESDDEILLWNWRVLAERARNPKRKLKRDTADMASSDEEAEYVEQVKNRVKKPKSNSKVQRKLRGLVRNTGHLAGC